MFYHNYNIRRVNMWAGLVLKVVQPYGCSTGASLHHLLRESLLTAIQMTKVIQADLIFLGII